MKTKHYSGSPSKSAPQNTNAGSSSRPGGKSKYPISTSAPKNAQKLRG